MRKIKFLLILLLIFGFTSFINNKETRADENYQIIIQDNEDLLSDKEEAALYQKMGNILPYGNVAFVSDSQYGDTSSYAKRLYRELFGTDSGFLFLIDMGRRNIWIYSDGRIYRTINKAYANTITDNVYRYASRGEYFNCAFNVYDQAQTLLDGGHIAQPMKYISNVLIALVSAVLVNFFVLSFERSNVRNQSVRYAEAMTTAVGVNILSKQMVKSRKSRHVESSGGGGGGGGYSGGGGGGGGGSSGGGGGHSF